MIKYAVEEREERGVRVRTFVIKNWFNLKNVIKEILIDNHM